MHSDSYDDDIMQHPAKVSCSIQQATAEEKSRLQEIRRQLLSQRDSPDSVDGPARVTLVSSSLLGVSFHVEQRGACHLCRVAEIKQNVLRQYISRGDLLLLRDDQNLSAMSAPELEGACSTLVSSSETRLVFARQSAFDNSEAEMACVAVTVLGESSIQSRVVADGLSCKRVPLAYHLLKNTGQSPKVVKVGRKYLSAAGKQLLLTDLADATHFEITQYQCSVTGTLDVKYLLTMMVIEKEKIPSAAQLFLSIHPNCRGGQLQVCLDEFPSPLTESDGGELKIKDGARNFVFTQVIKRTDNYRILGPMDYPDMIICVSSQDELVCLDTTHQDAVAKFTLHDPVVREVQVHSRKASHDSGFSSQGQLQGAGQVANNNPSPSKLRSDSLSGCSEPQAPSSASRTGEPRSGSGDTEKNSVSGRGKSRSGSGVRNSSSTQKAQKRVRRTDRERRNIQMCCSVS